MQIDTADELMSAELMFNAVWTSLDTPQLVALLSCLVECKEKNHRAEQDTHIPVDLATAMQTLQSFAKNVCDVTNVRPSARLCSVPHCALLCGALHWRGTRRTLRMR